MTIIGNNSFIPNQSGTQNRPLSGRDIFRQAVQQVRTPQTTQSAQSNMDGIANQPNNQINPTPAQKPNGEIRKGMVLDIRV